MRGHRGWSRVVLPLVLLGACVSAGTPTEWRSVTPLAQDATFGCAQGIVDSLGYTVTGADRGSGFLRGQFVVNSSSHDVLLVSALQASGGTELHVTVESYGFITKGVEQGRDGMTTPSQKVVHDGSLVMARCGPTNQAPRQQPQG